MPNDANWDVSLYGTNVTDERYDQARLNTGDYVIVVLSNDASEFGNITIELVKRGYTEKEIRKIWGGNFMRVFKEVEKIAKN